MSLFLVNVISYTFLKNPNKQKTTMLLRNTTFSATQQEGCRCRRKIHPHALKPLHFLFHLLLLFHITISELCAIYHYCKPIIFLAVIHREERFTYLEKYFSKSIWLSSTLMIPIHHSYRVMQDTPLFTDNMKTLSNSQ